MKIKHIIVQEDLDANPELKEAGVEVGKEVFLNEIVKDEEGEGTPQTEENAQ